MPRASPLRYDVARGGALLNRRLNVGFLSTRLSGTDGVSLEAAKWAEIFLRMGHSVAYCAGELDPTGPKGMLVGKMHFRHPDVQSIHDDVFVSCKSHPQELRARIDRIAQDLRPSIRAFAEEFSIDLLIAENVLAIPMNVPLGMALCEEIAASGLQTIAHHHDFAWERSRFAACAVPEILEACFPPRCAAIRHVVINSLAKRELLARRGEDSIIVPNVLDFERGSDGSRDGGQGLRAALGFEDDDVILLQPTRVVPRKGIELSIELAGRLRLLLHPRPVRLLISHAAGDEGMEYLSSLRNMAAAVGIEITMADDLVRAPTKASESHPTEFGLRDAYACADLVTYPSLIEGFGNAFLEAVYYRKPILVNRYPVYVSDIEPCGFDVIAIDECIESHTVESVATLLGDARRIDQMTDHNYRVASEHFSYAVAAGRLRDLLGSSCSGI